MQPEQITINSSLKMGVVFPSRTPVPIYQAKWLRNSEAHNANFQQHEYLKCQKAKYVQGK
jgi:hypothetical protein